MVQHNYAEIWRLSCSACICTFSMRYMDCRNFKNVTSVKRLSWNFQNTQTFQYPTIIRGERSKNVLVPCQIFSRKITFCYSPTVSLFWTGVHEVFHGFPWKMNDANEDRSRRLLIAGQKFWMFWKAKNKLLDVVVFSKIPHIIYHMLNVQTYVLHESLQTSS